MEYGARISRQGFFFGGGGGVEIHIKGVGHCGKWLGDWNHDHIKGCVQTRPPPIMLSS